MPSPTSVLGATARARSTLPRILASLPTLPPRNYPSSTASSSSEPILVQPLEWQERFPNSFYKVFRSKLRVKGPGGKLAVLGRGDAVNQKRQEAAVEEDSVEEDEEDMFAMPEESTEEASTHEHSGSTSSASAQPSGTTELDPTVQAYGKAWGVLFWNGEWFYCTPLTKLPNAQRLTHPQIFIRSTQIPFSNEIQPRTNRHPPSIPTRQNRLPRPISRIPSLDL